MTKAPPLGGAKFRKDLSECLPFQVEVATGIGPAKPGGLVCEPLKAATWVANATPSAIGHLKVVSQNWQERSHRVVTATCLSEIGAALPSCADQYWGVRDQELRWIKICCQ